MFFLLPLLLSIGNDDLEEQEILSKEDVQEKIALFLYHHARQEPLSPLFMEQVLAHYIHSLDPLKIYFLEEEVLSLKDQKETAYFQFKRGSFEIFQQIYSLFQRGVERSQQIKKEPSHFTEKEQTKALEFFCSTRGELKERLDQLKDTIKEKKEADRILQLAKLSPLHQAHVLLLKAFASTLDIHTAYLTPEEARSLFHQIAPSFSGIGISIKEENGSFLITDILPSSPAERSALLSLGDLLIGIDGISTEKLSSEEISKKIQGDAGSSIELLLQRGAERFSASLTREKISLPEERFHAREVEVDGFHFLHFHLLSFYEDENHSSKNDLLSTLEKHPHIDGLLLDLRKNGGGLLSQAIEVAGIFLKRGIVVSIQDRFVGTSHLRTTANAPLFSGPLVILIDRLSASCAEIVAQCLQDYGRALIVGDPQSFGKGSYQVTSLYEKKPIDPKGEVKITRGFYYTISGRSPQGKGVFSDICIPGPLTQLDIGEGFQPQPLISQEMNPFYPDRFEDLDAFTRYQLEQIPAEIPSIFPQEAVEKLKEESQQRLKENEAFQFLLSQKELHLKEWDSLVADESLLILKDSLEPLFNKKRVEHSSEN